MKKTTSQIRHEKLIDFLNQFPQYQTDGKPRCKKVNETIGSGELESLDTNIINTGVVVLTDYLNLRGGSIGGGINLYRLLQVYFNDVRKRELFNEIL